MDFSIKPTSPVISSEFERRYQTGIGKMRCSRFLGCKLLKWHYRSKHTFPQKLFQEVKNCASADMQDRSKNLKVSVFMDHSSIQGINKDDGSEYAIHDLVGELDLALACERFPSIILGGSSVVELYDDSQKKQLNFLLGEKLTQHHAHSEYEKCIKPLKICDQWPQIEESVLEGSSPSYTNNQAGTPDSSEVCKLESEDKFCASSALELPLTSSPLHSDISTYSETILDKPIKWLPGISSWSSRQLENGGFHTIRKLLHHFPRTYADVQNAHSESVDGQYMILVGRVLSSRGKKAGSSFAVLEVIVHCELGNAGTSDRQIGSSFSEVKKNIYMHLKRFFRGTRFTCRPFLQHMQSKYNEGDCVCVSGKVKKMHAADHYEMREYTIDVLEEEEANWDIDTRPYPLYPSKAGLKPDFLRDTISRALAAIPADIDPTPSDILKEFNLLDLQNAYLGIHRPRDKSEADLARRRLIFDDFFYLQLARLFQMLEKLGTWSEKEVLLNKYRDEKANAVPIEEWSTLTKMFLKALPYSLTPGQLNAVSEIIWDLKRPVPMNRLLQGEVGCGKTVVAFLSCMEVIGSGFQAAFMVPTELLAIQHYEHFMSFLENIGENQQKPSVALLTGSTPTKQSRTIRQGLQTGDISMVIGTHSLISEKLEFSALRIAVVDEQHRFGVIQRARFSSKLYSAPMSSNEITLDESSKDLIHMAPHILAMSATPIPRTLALALYGDMSLTQIKGVLPGRVAVETFALEGNESGFEKVYQMMHDELEDGGKIYLVYPVIEESEQLPQLHAAVSDHVFVSAKFEGYKCGLLHGRMKSEEKDEALKQFRSGETRILLATQVIEIGIDVPDASMMVVMNAERFGIAQLHQLRGRVGRGDKKSRCVFLSSTAGALERLKVLENSSDGFYLANIDLLFRGPGNLLGKKQSGHLPEFPVARLEVDGGILQEAHLAAVKVLGLSNDLERFPRLKVELSMRQPLCLLGD